MDKRQHLLDTALQLFYSKGVHAVGINEVLKVSGCAKKTLYHHFQSKDELLLAALEFRDQKFCSWFESLLVGSTSNLELIERLFDGLSKWFNNEIDELDTFRGCFFINTSGEFCDENSPILNYCKTHKDNIRSIVEKHLVEKDEELAAALCLLKEGAICTAHVCKDCGAAEQAFNTAKKLVEK